MHERTMRAVARWLFLSCCAVPTVVTLLVIVALSTPWAHRRAIQQVQRELGLRTGLSCRIGDFERISPSQWRLEDVELADAETGRLVARVRVVNWVRDDVETSIAMSQPEIQASHLDQLWQLLHGRFLCSPEYTDRPVRMTAADLSIIGGAGSMTLRDVAGWLQPSDQSISAVIRCVPAGPQRSDEAVEIQIRRDRGGRVPETAWALQTGSLRLPLAPLSDYFPMLDALGPDATFHGSATFRQDHAAIAGNVARVGDHHWTVDLSGSRLESLDLNRLSENLPHRLSGRGEVILDRFSIQAGHLVDAVGTVHAVAGQISPSLVQALEEQFFLRSWQPITHDTAYDLIAARFEVYASQLRIEGICGSVRGFEAMPAATLIAAAGRELLTSTGEPLEVFKVAHLIAPAHSVAVPVSGQTLDMLRLLRPPSSELPGSAVLSRHRAAGDSADQPAVRIGRLRGPGTPGTAVSQPR